MSLGSFWISCSLIILVNWKDKSDFRWRHYFFRSTGFPWAKLIVYAKSFFFVRCIKQLCINFLSWFIVIEFIMYFKKVFVNVIRNNICVTNVCMTTQEQLTWAVHQAREIVQAKRIVQENQFQIKHSTTKFTICLGTTDWKAVLQSVSQFMGYYIPITACIRLYQEEKQLLRLKCLVALYRVK